MKKKTAAFLIQTSPNKLKSPGSNESAGTKIGLRQCHEGPDFSKNSSENPEKMREEIVRTGLWWE